MEDTGVETFLVEIILNGTTESYEFPISLEITNDFVENKIRSTYSVTGGTLSSRNDRPSFVKRFAVGEKYYFIKFTPPPQTGATGIAVQNTVGTPVAESRKRRWDGLNTVLDINKKAKTRKDGQNSLGYSYANWEQVKDYFPIVQGSVGVISSAAGLPEPLLSALHQYLSFATICFGSISEGHEAKRVHFIAPIIIIVCSHFKGDIQILAEEEIEGNRVHAHGHFEFVLKRKEKRICIVEAKKDDILQGRTQSLVGCESLCDVEELSVTFGIATNYLEWCFLKDEADKVTEEMLTISLEDGRPMIESVRAVANKIIAILE